MGIENRLEPRAPLELRVDYEGINTFFADYTANISKGGTFIKTPAPMPLGTRLTFRLSVAGFSLDTEIQGEVRFVLDAEAAARSRSEPGMGIRFLFDDDAQRASLEAAVEKIMKDSLGDEIYRRLLGKAS